KSRWHAMPSGVAVNPEPPEPVIFIRTRPKRRIRSPQATYLVVFLPVRERAIHGSGELLWQGVGYGIDLRRGFPALPGPRRFQQLRKGVDKLAQPLFQEGVRHGFHRDAGPFESIHGVGSVFNVFRQALPKPAV